MFTINRKLKVGRKAGWVKHNKKFAFTLAEILITLGVIGVVASITMPTLIANYQKQQAVTQLKKAYTEINQALKLSEVENGEMSNWFVEDELQAKYDFFQNYIIKYLKTTKVCIPTNNECYSNDDISESHISFITVSGYSVLGWVHASGNGGWLYVDINGPKKGPNQNGKDRFVIIMQFDNNYNINGEEEKKIVDKPGVFFAGLGISPALTRDELINGSENMPKTYKNMLCNNDSSKDLCGALIVTDGWQIKDDYPW